MGSLLRRLRPWLVGLGLIILLGGIVFWWSTRKGRLAWAQSLADTALERSQLFDLRDTMNVDLAAQAQLTEFFEAFREAKRRASKKRREALRHQVPSDEETEAATKEWWARHEARRAELRRAQPQLPPWHRVTHEQSRGLMERLDTLLLGERVWLADWVSLPRDASMEQLHRPGSTGHELREIGRWWWFEGVAQEDPSGALAALGRLHRASLLPLRRWTRSNADDVGLNRDHLHLWLLARGRLPEHLLEPWLGEPSKAFERAAQALRVERAFVAAPHLHNELATDGDVPKWKELGEEHSRSRTIDWWCYARFQGEGDAHRIIQTYVRWEKYLRGHGDLDDLDEARTWWDEGGPYFDQNLRNIANEVASTLWDDVKHRAWRAFAAALASRDKPTAPYWADEEAFRTALGKHGELLRGGSRSIPLRYRRVSADEARLEVDPAYQTDPTLRDKEWGDPSARWPQGRYIALERPR